MHVSIFHVNIALYHDHMFQCVRAQEPALNLLNSGPSPPPILRWLMTRLIVCNYTILVFHPSIKWPPTPPTMLYSKIGDVEFFHPSLLSLLPALDDHEPPITEGPWKNWEETVPHQCPLPLPSCRWLPTNSSVIRCELEAYPLLPPPPPASD
jgi:hypothetical protein